MQARSESHFISHRVFHEIYQLVQDQRTSSNTIHGAFHSATHIVQNQGMACFSIQLTLLVEVLWVEIARETLS